MNWWTRKNWRHYRRRKGLRTAVALSTASCFLFPGWGKVSDSGSSPIQVEWAHVRRWLCLWSWGVTQDVVSGFLQIAPNIWAVFTQNNPHRRVLGMPDALLLFADKANLHLKNEGDLSYFYEEEQVTVSFSILTNLRPHFVTVLPAKRTQKLKTGFQMEKCIRYVLSKFRWKLLRMRLLSDCLGLCHEAIPCFDWNDVLGFIPSQIMNLLTFFSLVFPHADRQLLKRR